LIRAGERVPEGFCITTVVHEAVQESQGGVPEDVRREIVQAYERLGAGAVAVRSSATAEDLPHASFAGQHDTFLDVTGTEAVNDAVRRCWDSLGSPRAIAYREAAAVPHGSVRMGVVVQRMVDPIAAGVLFTANPITGSRSEMVVDAVAGLGDVVVEGSVSADHYVLTREQLVTSPGGCLGSAQLRQLRDAGERLQRRAGSPRDVEWAFDRTGTLWLLQSRAITTLFPLPASTRPGPRVFLEVGHMQGMLRPFTPMGMAAMRVATAQWLESIGRPADPSEGHPGMVDAAGRMYLDLTAIVRSRSLRTKLPAALRIYGPRVSGAMVRVLEDARFAPVPGRPYRVRSVVAVAARLAPGLVVGVLGALIRPARARNRAFRAAAEMEGPHEPQDLRTAADRVRLAAELQRPFLRGMTAMLPPLYAAMIARAAAVGLLAGVAAESEVDATLRGAPYNVTTEMDLALWRLACAVGEHRDLLLHTPTAELAARYRVGELPELGLGGFLCRYGHRGAAEIDVGVPRWGEDPTPVFAALAGYLRVTDPGQAPDRRFARAADEAVAKIDELVRRARRTRPVRARLAGFLLRRSRQLAGLRELPKFAWLHAFAAMRRQLLAAGTELAERGLLERADDIMFLDLREALAAADGKDQREPVAARRTDYERECRRRSVPGLLLSDGTIPEALTPRTPAADGTLVGMAAAPGAATGRARVILDPAGAQVEPGDILVAPTTDPGWTPLFLTAGGLVTETGSPMAHGPTVAREYGIPAVICVRDATQLIATGQLITVDGASGTVVLADAAVERTGMA
jgi:pyruvate,water dikinase